MDNQIWMTIHAATAIVGYIILQYMHVYLQD